MKKLFLKNISANNVVIGDNQIASKQKISYSRIKDGDNVLRDTLRLLGLGEVVAMEFGSVDALPFSTDVERKIVYKLLGSREERVDDVYQAEQITALSKAIDSITTDTSNLIANGRGNVIDSDGKPVGIVHSDSIIYNDEDEVLQIAPSAISLTSGSLMSLDEAFVASKDFSIELIFTIEEQVGDIIGDSNGRLHQSDTNIFFSTATSILALTQYNRVGDMVNVQLVHNGTSFLLTVTNLTTGKVSYDSLDEALSPITIKDLFTNMRTMVTSYSFINGDGIIHNYNMDQNINKTTRSLLPNLANRTYLNPKEDNQAFVLSETINLETTDSPITLKIREIGAPTHHFCLFSGDNFRFAYDTNGAIYLEYKLLNGDLERAEFTDDLIIVNGLETELIVKVIGNILHLEIGGVELLRTLNSSREPLIASHVGYNTFGSGSFDYGNYELISIGHLGVGNILADINEPTYFDFNSVAAGLKYKHLPFTTDMAIRLEVKTTEDNWLIQSTSEDFELHIREDHLTMVDSDVTANFMHSESNLTDGNWHDVIIYSTLGYWNVIIDGTPLTGTLAHVYSNVGDVDIYFGIGLEGSIRNIRTYTGGDHKTGLCVGDVAVSDHGKGQYSSSKKQLIENNKFTEFNIDGTLKGFTTDSVSDLFIDKTSIELEPTTLTTDTIAVSHGRDYIFSLKAIAPTDDITSTVTVKMVAINGNGNNTQTIINSFVVTDTEELQSIPYTPVEGDVAVNIVVENTGVMRINYISLVDVLNPLLMEENNLVDSTDITLSSDGDNYVKYLEDIEAYELRTEDNGYVSLFMPSPLGSFLVEFELAYGDVADIFVGNNSASASLIVETERKNVYRAVVYDGNVQIKRNTNTDPLKVFTVRNIKVYQLHSPAMFVYNQEPIERNANSMAIEVAEEVTSDVVWDAFRIESNVSYNVSLSIKNDNASLSGIDLTLCILDRDLKGKERSISNSEADIYNGVVLSDHNYPLLSKTAIGTEWTTYNFTFTNSSVGTYGGLVLTNSSGTKIEIRDVAVTSSIGNKFKFDELRQSIRDITKNPMHMEAPIYMGGNPLFFGANNDKILINSDNLLIFNGKVMATANDVANTVTFTNQYNSTADAASRTAMSPLGVQGALGSLKGTYIDPMQSQVDDILTLLSSDDTALDSIQEIVDFIQTNADDLSNLTINNISGLQSALDSKAKPADVTAMLASMLESDINLNGSLILAVNEGITFGSTQLTLSGGDLFIGGERIALASEIDDAVTFTNDSGSTLSASSRTAMAPSAVQTAINNKLAAVGLGINAYNVVLPSFDSTTLDAKQYVSTAATTGTPPPGASVNGFITVTRSGSTEILMEYQEIGSVSTTNKQSWFKVYNNGGSTQWSSWVRNWNSDNLPSMNGIRDPNGETVMKPGAHGLGAVVSVAEDSNAIAATGIWKDDAGAWNSHFDSDWGVIQVSMNGSDRVQFAMAKGDGGKTIAGVRHRTHSGWSNIAEFWSNGNLSPVTTDTDQTITGTKAFSSNLSRTAPNVGGMEGGHQNASVASSTNPIYCIGSGWTPQTTSLDNMHGVGFTYTNAANFMTVKMKSANVGWGLYIANSGSTGVIIGSEKIYASEYLTPDGNVIEVANEFEESGSAILQRTRGATFATGSGAATGALTVLLPMSFYPGTFISFDIMVQTGENNESFKVTVAGLPSASTGTWGRCTALIDGHEDINYNVRFGNIAGNPCIWIGEVDSVWSYVRFNVTNIQTHFGGNWQAEKWRDGWASTITTTFDTVEVNVGNANRLNAVSGQTSSVGSALTSLTNVVNSNYVDNKASKHKLTPSANLPIGWYTIAVNPNGSYNSLATGRFGVIDVTPNHRQVISLTATNSRGKPGLAVNYMSYHSTTSVTKLRVKTLGSSDGALLQVYLGVATNNMAVFGLDEKFFDTDWNLRNFIPDDTDPVGNSAWASLVSTKVVPVDDIGQGGMSISGKVFANNKELASVNSVGVVATALLEKEVGLYEAIQQVADDLAGIPNSPITMAAPIYMNGNPIGLGPGSSRLLLDSSGLLIYDGKVMATTNDVANTVTFTNQYNSTADAASRTAMSPLGVQGAIGNLQGDIIDPLGARVTTIESLLVSDNSALDSLQEVVNYVEANKDDLANLAISNIAGLTDELSYRPTYANAESRNWNWSGTHTFDSAPNMSNGLTIGAASLTGSGTTLSYAGNIQADRAWTLGQIAVNKTAISQSTTEVSSTKVPSMNAMHGAIAAKQSKWEVQVSNMAAVPGVRGFTYIQSMNDDNEPVGATAVNTGDLATGEPLMLNSLASRENAKINYIRINADAVAISGATPDVDAKIKIIIWDMSNSTMTEMHTLKVPVTAGTVGEYDDPEGDGLDVVAKLTGLDLDLTDDVRYGLTFEPVLGLADEVNTLTNFTIRLGGLEP